MHAAQTLDLLHHELRHLDLEASEALELAGREIDQSGAAAEVEKLVAAIDFPPVSAAAVTALPFPSVRAVLMTTAFIRYIGQPPNVIDVFWTLLYYWDDEQAELLGITEWRSVVLSRDTSARSTDEGVGHLVRWLEAVLLVAECPWHAQV